MRFILAVFAITVAFAQTNQVFRLTQNQNQQQLTEMASLIRATANIQQVSADDIQKTVSVAGSTAQIATADWLIHQLDLSAASSGMHEFRPAGSSDDLVRVFYVSQAADPRDLQETVTAVRSIGDIQRISIYNPLKAVAVRGTSRQMAFAAWLFDQFDQPVGAAPPAPEFQLSGDDVARVFQLTNAEMPQQLQEIVVLIRSLGDISRLFVNNARREIAVRSSTARMELAAWLVNQLDKPATGCPAAGEPPHEYRLATDHSLVRLFFLHVSQPEQLRNVMMQVRSTSQIRRLFIYNALGALAVRGTDGQVAIAEKTIEEMKL